MFEAYRNRANFRVVYIREAHPTDGWQVETNIKFGIFFAEPQNLTERTEMAETCSRGLDLTIPTLIDSMDNAAEQTFQSWPERLFVLSATGQITYQGGKGPYDFNIDELYQFLSATLPKSRML